MDHQEWYPLPSCKIQQWMGELVSWMWFIVRLLCFSPERFKQFFWMLGMQHIGRLGTPMMKSVNWHGPGLDLSPKCILHATSGSKFPMVEQLRGWLFGQWSENAAWTLAKGPGSLNGYARLYGYWSPKWLLCPALVACLRVLLSLTAVDRLEPQWLDILQLDWFYPA